MIFSHFRLPFASFLSHSSFFLFISPSASKPPTISVLQSLTMLATSMQASFIFPSFAATVSATDSARPPADICWPSHFFLRLFHLKFSTHNCICFQLNLCFLSLFFVPIVTTHLSSLNLRFFSIITLDIFSVEEAKTKILTILPSIWEISRLKHPLYALVYAAKGPFVLYKINNIIFEHGNDPPIFRCLFCLY